MGALLYHVIRKKQREKGKPMKSMNTNTAKTIVKELTKMLANDGYKLQADDLHDLTMWANDIAQDLTDCGADIDEFAAQTIGMALCRAYVHGYYDGLLAE